MRLINLPALILSFLIGILYIYYTNPDQEDIKVYTTDDNKHLFQFNDKINNCFNLKQRIVKCSNDVEEIPIQI